MKKLSFLCTFAVLFSSFLVIENSDAKKPRRNKFVNHQITSAQSKNKNDIITADYALLMDFDTNEMFYSKKAEERFLPASMTKLMTIYVVFCALKNGKIRLEDKFPVSIKAQSMEGSRSFFRAGTSAKVEDLIKSIIIHSGNDACVVMSEGLYGDEAAFVEEMNQKVEEFGLTNTHFNNAHGLPDENHYSSAYDLAIIAKHLINDFPQYYHYFSEKSFTINGITQQNRNVLLGNSLGVDGLKTGHTKASGHGIVVSAQKDGKRLICVVNGCATMKDRAQDANKLLAVGFRQFSNLKIAQAGHPITTAKVWMGVKNNVRLCTREDIVIQIPEKYKKLVKVEAKIVEPIEAPIEYGKKIGTLTYKFGNFVSKEYELFADEAVERLGIVDRLIFSVNNLVFGSSSGSKFFSKASGENLKNSDNESKNENSPFAWRKDSQNEQSQSSEPSSDGN